MGGQRAVLGIDLGTSGVKVLVVGLNDAVLGRGRAEYPVLVPAVGRAESDPGDWWRATCRAVRQAVAQAGDADIVGLAVAGQMHGVVLARACDGNGADAAIGADAAGDRALGDAVADAHGGAVRQAIVWLDQRAAAAVDRYAELPAALTRGLGNRPSAGMAGPILWWLVRHEPENVAAARRALQPKDWVRLRLTGAAATDPTDASGTLLFDLERGAWADDLIAALGLPGDKLPPI